ncbi:MAG: S46 family peptidase, partial [Bacteroidota bacterium]|nr:S46 family peptidase [Bacteroidota bacterium]
MIRKILCLAVAVSIIFNAKADEGMWLLMKLKKMNYDNMQKMGLNLTAEDIYSVNNSSLKDAVVSLGGFCTGEIISPNGLMLTNHHCAFDAIQSHSSVKNDYLTDGFWAKSYAEELPNEGLTASFFVRMEDVSEKVLSQLTPDMTENQRKAAIKKITEEIKSEATTGTHYNSEVKSFFEGNEFYLFIYETFQDIRLVGAPPSSIGKFGGDTDNWMWPRHTGDFSMFRVYM